MNCVHCRAPINVPVDGLEMKCGYCGNTMPVPDADARRARAHAAKMQAEAERRRQAAKAEKRVERKIAVKAARSSARSVKLSVFMSLIPGVVIVAIATHQLWLPKLRAFRWDGKSTYVCEVNGTASFSDVKAEIAVGPAFKLNTNCKITCTNCEIEAESIAQLGTNGEFTLQGGKATAQDIAFDFGGANGKLRINGTEVIAETLVEGNRPDIELRDVSLTAKAVGIDLPSHASARLKNSKVHAALPIRLGGHAKVSFRDGELIGVGVAAEVENYGQLELLGKPTVAGKIVPKGRRAKITGLDVVQKVQPEAAPKKH